MHAIDLLPWDETGIALLEALNTAAGKRHLGGPESAAKLAERHVRYLTYCRPGEVEILRIKTAGEVVGSVCYWERQERDGAAYEMGWEIVPARHGSGIGTAAAAALLARLKPVARHPQVYAYPTPDNGGSNGICRKLGFVLLGIEDAEYPKGVWSPHSVWRLDLATWLPPAP